MRTSLKIAALSALLIGTTADLNAETFGADGDYSQKARNAWNDPTNRWARHQRKMQAYSIQRRQSLDADLRSMRTNAEIRRQTEAIEERNDLLRQYMQD